MEPDPIDRLQQLIAHRRSSRQPFDSERRVSERELAAIVEAARWAPTAHNMQNFRLVLVDDPPTLAALGDIRTAVSSTFIVENYRQLAWSVDELSRRGTGILGTSFPPAWRTDDPALVPGDASRLLNEVIAGAPLVVVVLYDASKRAPASEGDVLGMISVGCVLENIWLAATALGLDLQVVSAFGGADAEPRICELLEVPRPWRIAYCLRLGHAVSAVPYARVRRPAAAIAARNRYVFPREPGARQ